MNLEAKSLKATNHLNRTFIPFSSGTRFFCKYKCLLVRFSIKKHMAN